MTKHERLLITAVGVLAAVAAVIGTAAFINSVKARNDAAQAWNQTFDILEANPELDSPLRPTPTPYAPENCDRQSYPDVCIPRYPPDLDCNHVQFKRFRVLPPDPHGFDRDRDGIGCE
jgi:hypothetical protein